MSAAGASSRSDEFGERFLQPRSGCLSVVLNSDSFSVNKLRFSTSGLYGREHETSKLLEAYRDAVSTKRKAVIMISGYAGTGKSAIVKRLHAEVRRDNMNGKKKFFAGGKFQFNRRNEPYVGIIAAFSQLCASILLLKQDDPDAFAQLQQTILDRVGSEGGVLSSIIPKIEEVLDQDTIELKEEMPKNRFKFLLRQFVQAICMHADTTVLFLDDLQWIDTASLELINALVTDSGLSGFLLVGCYRDNEVDESHPVMPLLRHCETLSGFRVTHITVGNLSVENVNEFISDLLNVPEKSETLGLATITHGKTLGNIFFVIQFLRSLQDNDLLVYNFGTMSWKWNDDEIKASTHVSDNVLELLQTKLKNQIRHRVLELLQVASFLGTSFDQGTLSAVAETLDRRESTVWSSDSILDTNNFKGNEHVARRESVRFSSTSVEECLFASVEEGLLEITEDDAESPATFHFSHDQIQLAATSFIPLERKSVFELQIGEILLERLSESDLDKMVFVVVELLNHGSHLMSDHQRVQTAQLNLHAGKKAMLSSAFKSSSTYLSTGIRLLGENHWGKNYSLCLNLMNAAMRAEYCSGNFDQVYHCANEVLELEGKPIRDKLGAYFALAGCLGDQGQPMEALEICLGVLSQLGARFPKRYGKAYIAWEWSKIKLLLKRRPLTTWSDLPEMHDKVQLKAMQMMSRCGVFAYAAHADLIFLLVFKMMRWSILYGMSKYSPPAFSGYAFLTVAAFGDIREAYEVGNFALSLSDKLDAKKTQSFTFTIYNMSVCHWVTPLQITRKEFLKGYQSGMQTGDIQDAMMSVFHFCYVCYVTGEPLSKLEADLRTYSNQMKEYDQTLTRHLTVVIWQSVLNLMSFSDDPVVLTGEAMDQDELLAKSKKFRRIQLRDKIKVDQLQLAYMFGRLDLASDLFDATQKVARTNPAGIIIWRTALFEGLTAFALARSRKDGSHKKWNKRGCEIIKKVHRWVRKGNVNCVHILQFLEAEKSVCLGNVNEAKRKYEKTIASAGRSGFRSDAALACERAGDFFLSVGDSEWATYYLKMALQHYTEWEAWAKVDHLYQKYGKLIPDFSTQKTEHEGRHKGEEALAA